MAARDSEVWAVGWAAARRVPFRRRFSTASRISLPWPRVSGPEVDLGPGGDWPPGVVRDNGRRGVIFPRSLPEPPSARPSAV